MTALGTVKDALSSPSVLSRGGGGGVAPRAQGNPQEAPKSALSRLRERIFGPPSGFPGWRAVWDAPKGASRNRGLEFKGDS